MHNDKSVLPATSKASTTRPVAKVDASPSSAVVIAQSGRERRFYLHANKWSTTLMSHQILIMWDFPDFTASYDHKTNHELRLHLLAILP